MCYAWSDGASAPGAHSGACDFPRPWSVAEPSPAMLRRQPLEEPFRGTPTEPPNGLRSAALNRDRWQLLHHGWRRVYAAGAGAIYSTSSRRRIHYSTKRCIRRPALVQHRIPLGWCCGPSGPYGIDVETSACADVKRVDHYTAVIPPVAPFCEAREDNHPSSKQCAQDVLAPNGNELKHLHAWQQPSLPP